MRLPVIEPITYISPSAYLAWVNCNYQVYIEKMSGLLKPKRKTNRAARIGILFDAIIKDHLIQARSMDAPHCNLPFEIKQLKPEDDELAVAQEIARGYIEHGCMNRLLKAKKLFLQRTLYTQVGGVPLLGKLDADVDGIVFDWKTRGFGKNPTSPTPGYNRRIDFNSGEKNQHPDKTNLHKRKPDWAIQMLFYNWMQKTSYKYIIHEIVNTKKGIVFVEHEDIIPTEFSNEIWEQVKHMWKCINGLDAELLEPVPTSFRCEKYNTLCNSAVHCEAYQHTLGGQDGDFYR